LIAGAGLAGCSKKDNPTSPYGAGGGGGGGGGSTGNTPFNSGSMASPATFVRTFPTAGTVGYHCQFHVSMGMVGSVTVAAGGADSALVDLTGTSFSPSSVTIKPGGYVHWKVQNGTHTVTSD
jgi:plastocyanin